jgi:hypothetical protein
VKVGKPALSTARAEALKEKLRGAPAAGQPVAPRPAGSTARAEQFKALQKHMTAPVAVAKPLPARTSARQIEVDPATLPPPPSGLREDLAAQTDTDIEAVEPIAEEKSEPLSPQFVALARQERQILKARRAFEVEKAAWEKEKAEHVPKSALKSDPLKALGEAGVTYEQLVELQLSQENPDPNQALLDKIAALEEKLAAVDGQFQKRDRDGYEAAVNQIRKDIKLLVDSDPTFEMIKATEQSEEVVRLVERVFKDEGEILSVEEACRTIEEQLAEREYQKFERLSKLQKIQQRLGKPAEPAEETPTQIRSATQTKTLTNLDATQRPLTARERAIRAYNRE